MKYKAITLSLMFFCFACSVHCQKVSRQAKEKYVVVPNEVVLAAVAFQPDCPIHFEEAEILAAMDGSETAAYTVRNVGAKPIRSFTVGLPGGAIETWSEEFSKKLFMPGERTPGDDDIEI